MALPELRPCGMQTALLAVQPFVMGLALCTTLLLQGCGSEQPTEPAPSKDKTTPNFAYASGSIQDNFTDASGTLLENHDPDGGSVSFSWTQLFGQDPAVIEGNALASYDWAYVTSSSDADSAEIEVEVTGDIATIPRQYDIGLLLRTNGSSAFSGYTIYWSMYGSDGIGTSNAFITVDSPENNLVYQDNLSVPTIGTHRFSAAVQQNGVINVYIDGVLMATGSDPSPIPSGRPGLTLDYNGDPPGLVRITSFSAGHNEASERQLVVACTPSTVVRGQTVTCTARLNTAEVWTPLLVVSEGPQAELAFATFNTIDDGKGMESKGPAVFSSTFRVSGTFLLPDGAQSLDGKANFTVAPRPATMFQGPSYPAEAADPSVFDQTLHGGRRPPVFGAYPSPRLDLGTVGELRVDFREAAEGPNSGFSYLGTPPPLEIPVVFLHDALNGMGGWYHDQNGIDHGQTTGFMGLRYCVGSDITSALRADVIRHEAGLPKSHHTIWVNTLFPGPARDLLEGFVFETRNHTRDAQMRQALHNVWDVYTVGVSRTIQREWDVEDLGGPDYPDTQVRIGCAFDNNPGD